MNLDQICRHCRHARVEHAGTTHQGRCPPDSEHVRRPVLEGRGPLPYLERIWRPVVGLPGNGPWRVLEECISPTHNTVSAAEARRGIACICPHALEVRSKRLAARSTRPASGGQSRHTPTMVSQPVTMPQPDLSSGKCLTERGQEIISATFESKYAFPAAQALCERCPVRRACQEYTLAGEVPAGSWGGVWGGLTPADRRRVAAR